MGKNSATSWLSMVKKAFRSPVKEKTSRRRREECGQEEEEKKREKRRWLFRRPSNINHVQQYEAKTPPSQPTEDRHATLDGRAIAVAEATTAAAEAAVATAQAAVKIVQLSSRPSDYANVREHYIYAAIVIQTAFRGYLARRALRALKGLVKLQALVRGHNVRRQTKMALKCMQSLVRVQDRVLLDQQCARLSHEGYYYSRKSMFDETNALWESRYLQDIRRRRSMSRDMSCAATDEWDDRPQTSEVIEALFQNKKEAALKREKALAYAFSNQIWRSRRNNHQSTEDEKEIEERTKWLDRWMATKQWESNNNNNNRASTDRRDSIKTVEIDSYKLHQIRKPNGFSLNQYPPTPSPCRTKPLQVRSASPRCYSSAANTPSLASTYCTTNGASRYANVVPNYMAATESARAKARSQSTPRQRPSTPERERGSVSLAKKRLSYPAPENNHVGIGGSSFSQNLRSPSFKSAFEGHYGTEKDSHYSSYYSESFGGEISPCSTTDLRWLK